MKTNGKTDYKTMVKQLRASEKTIAAERDKLRALEADVTAQAESAEEALESLMNAIDELSTLI